MERMKKMLELATVGIDTDALIPFVEQQKQALETDSLQIPGELGKEGVRIIKTSNIDANKRLAVVGGFEVEGVRYTIYYSTPE